MLTQKIELNKLEKSPNNVRKTIGAGLQELKASIKAHGLMQNLVVCPGAKKGTFYVIAGGRRLEALKQLAKEDKNFPLKEIQCNVVKEDATAELGLAENTMRTAMHPADEYEAFEAISKQGVPAKKIAERFGTTEKHVLQRLKLGQVAPEILKAYRKEELDLDTLEIYASAADQKQQLKIWKSLDANGRRSNYSVRKALQSAEVLSTDSTVKFVTLKAYKAAGGKTREDLFGDEIYIEDKDLLQKLLNEKTKTITEKYKKEGWAWVKVMYEKGYEFIHQCGRIEEEPTGAPESLKKQIAEQEEITNKADKAFYDHEGDDEEAEEKLRETLDEEQEKLDKLESKLESFNAFDPEQIKIAGVCITFDYHGNPEVKKGLVLAADKSKIKKTTKGSTSAIEGKAEKKEISDALAHELRDQRQKVMKLAVAKGHPDLAFDIMIFNMATDRLSKGGGRIYGESPSIDFKESSTLFSKKNAADDEMKKLYEKLPLDFLKEKGETAKFAKLCELSREKKMQLLAYCVGLAMPSTLKKKGSWLEAGVERYAFNAATLWRPTEENYFSRVSKEVLLKVGVGIFGAQFNKDWANAKKSAVVAEMVKIFNPKNIGTYTKEQQEKIINWLPAGMQLTAEKEGK